MKKIFCAVLALAAMASCSKEYIVAENKQTIGFGEAFVDNGTRADYSSGNDVDEFLVYGTLEGNGNTVQIFKGALVERPNGLTGYNPATAWTCAETQYWVPSASYKFAAIVDGAATATAGLPETIPFTVADGEGNLDLLYAEATATTNDVGTPNVDLVAFTFNHLLSKVQFTVANNMATDYSIKVTGITVTGAMKDGLCTIADPFENSTWNTTTEAKVPSLTFGTTGVIDSATSAVASETRQILPVNQTLAVTIAYDINYKGTKVSSATKAGTIPAMTYAKNTVYNITAAIDGNKIEFTVTGVEGFNDPAVEEDVE